MDASKAALNFVDTINSLVVDLNPEARAKLAKHLGRDLAWITRECGFADGEFREPEKQVAGRVFGVLWTFIALQPFAIFGDWEALRSFLLSGGSSPEQESELMGAMETALQAFPPDQADEYETIRAVRRMDDRYGSDHAASVRASLYRYARALAAAHEGVDSSEEEALRAIRERLFLGADSEKHDAHKAMLEEEGDITQKEDGEETLEDVMAELDALVGLGNIKEEVNTLVNFLKIQAERKTRGLAETPVSLHCVFFGPPGTGKTSVARLVSRIFRQMGFLEKGHLVETDRAGLVGAHIGSTAQKTDELVTEAMGGVLFVDEAYALKPDEDSGKDFGQEAIDILIKRMEDNRDKLAVVVAGYPDEMQRFLESNPGLKSRFNRYFHFKDYSPEELLAIFNIFCEKANYKANDGAQKQMLRILTMIHSGRDRAFGNGRLSRNLFEKIIERQANRLAVLKNISDEDLVEITVEDLPEIPGLPIEADAKSKSSGEEDDVPPEPPEARTGELPDWMKSRKRK